MSPLAVVTLFWSTGVMVLFVLFVYYELQDIKDEEGES